MKLSQTQQKVLEKLQNTCRVCKKYETFEDFFDNSKYEQITFTTASYCNDAYNSSKKYKEKDSVRFEEMRKDFEACKNENILITFARTDTILKLQKLGYIKIIRSASYEGGAELVKVIADL